MATSKFIQARGGKVGAGNPWGFETLQRQFSSAPLPLFALTLQRDDAAASENLTFALPQNFHQKYLLI